MRGLLTIPWFWICCLFNAFYFFLSFSWKLVWWDRWRERTYQMEEQSLKAEQRWRNKTWKQNQDPYHHPKKNYFKKQVKKKKNCDLGLFQNAKRHFFGVEHLRGICVLFVVITRAAWRVDKPTGWCISVEMVIWQGHGQDWLPELLSQGNLVPPWKARTQNQRCLAFYRTSRSSPPVSGKLVLMQLDTYP